MTILYSTIENTNDIEGVIRACRSIFTDNDTNGENGYEFTLEEALEYFHVTDEDDFYKKNICTNDYWDAIAREHAKDGASAGHIVSIYAEKYIMTVLGWYDSECDYEYIELDNNKAIIIFSYTDCDR